MQMNFTFRLGFHPKVTSLLFRHSKTPKYLQCKSPVVQSISVMRQSIQDWSLQWSNMVGLEKEFHFHPSFLQKAWTVRWSTKWLRYQESSEIWMNFISLYRGMAVLDSCWRNDKQIPTVHLLQLQSTSISKATQGSVQGVNLFSLHHCEQSDKVRGGGMKDQRIRVPFALLGVFFHKRKLSL